MCSNRNPEFPWNPNKFDRRDLQMLSGTRNSRSENQVMRNGKRKQTLTIAERKVLDAAKAHAALLRNKVKREERGKDIFMRARLRAERQFKGGLGERLLAAAGIERAALDQRLAKDRASVKSFLAKRAAEARHGASALRRRQLERQTMHLARLGFGRPQRPPHVMPYEPGPLPHDAFLGFADSIEIHSTEQLKQRDSSIGWEKNIARIELGHYDDPQLFTFSVGTTVFVDLIWHFLWTPFHDGPLDAAAFLYINGHENMFISPGCGIGGGGSAAVFMNAFITIAQINPNGKPFIDTSLPRKLLDRQIRKDSDESVGRVDYYGIDIPDVIKPDRNFPLVGTSPVTISLTLALQVSCRSSTANLDLFNSGFGAHMAGVLVTLR
jgi:hypothetical protein